MGLRHVPVYRGCCLSASRSVGYDYDVSQGIQSTIYEPIRACNPLEQNRGFIMAVKHIAFLKFKEEITPDTIDECYAALRGLVDKIDGLEDFIGGPYESDEGLNDGFTHGFVMTFDTPENRDAYLPHPDHMEVVNLVQPKLEKLVVFDFNY